MLYGIRDFISDNFNRQNSRSVTSLMIHQFSDFCSLNNTYIFLKKTGNINNAIHFFSAMKFMRYVLSSLRLKDDP
jgi:hypothetical protein